VAAEAAAPVALTRATIRQAEAKAMRRYFQNGPRVPPALSITGFATPFIGVMDLVAEVDQKRTVLDFKTSGSSYAEHEARLSDQLTAYQLAEPEAEQMALCVLVKTKEPKIEWHLSERSPNDLSAYLAKAGYVAHEIAASRFYKRPGMWCAWCDFLPVCLRDERKMSETLVSIH
jgi:hypothetical protein